MHVMSIFISTVPGSGMYSTLQCNLVDIVPQKSSLMILPDRVLQPIYAPVKPAKTQLIESISSWSYEWRISSSGSIVAAQRAPSVVFP